MFFSVEKWGGILKRGEDTSSPLSLAGQGEPCGTADGTAVPSKYLSKFLSTNNQICILFYNAKSKAHLSARFEAILFPYPI